MKLMSGSKQTNAIVFGANGYLGRNLVHFLGAAECKVRAFDIHDETATPGIEYSTVNIAEPNQLVDIDWDVDFVYMFAGLTGTASGFVSFREFVTTNEIGLLCVLDAVRRSGRRPRVVFPSTRLVYEGSDDPLNEDSPKAAKTVYAVNKQACESLLQVYSNAFSLPFTIYRICVPYGNAVAGDYSYGTVGTLLKHAKDNATIRLYGDGSLRRTFTHIEDICRQIIGVSHDQRSINGTFNVFGEELSLFDAATAIAERHSARIDFTKWPEEDWRIESGHTVFDANKLLTIHTDGLKHRFKEWVQHTA